MNSLFHSPPIIENIFKHLGARDLSTCAQVCKLWSSMANIELKRRNKITWFFQYSVNEYDNMSPAMLGKYDEDPLFEGALRNQLNDLRIKPAFCIALASYSFLENFGKLGYSANEPEKKKPKSDTLVHKRKFLHSVIKTVLHPYLPAESKCTFTVAPGIVGCQGDYSPVEIEDGTTVTGFCLPKMPGVEIHHFSVNGQKCDLSDLVSSGTNVKCLLVFLTPRGTSIINKLIQSCLVREESKVAVGGAIVDHTESLLGSAIAFCGENIEASSVIIGPKDKKEELQNKLKIFQETGLLKHRCFAFMFACVARGYYYYRHHNFESSTFRSLYPRVPLIGVFGNGEIGVNYFPHVPTENKVFRLGKFTKCIKKYLHSYTTVFVLVAVKQ